MIILIKDVKSIKGNCYGITKYLGRKRIKIEISLKLNKGLDEYGSTLLHELLHVWLVILKANGAIMNQRKEHTFIYAVEKQIINLLKILVKEK